MCRPCFISSADWWTFGWFPFVSCYGQFLHRFLCGRMFSLLFGSNPVVELLDHTTTWHLMLLWDCRTVSKIVVTVCILIRNARGHWFLHISGTCYFLVLFVCWLQSSWWAWSRVSYFCFAFLWWLLIFSTFSCACWLSVYFIWRYVCSDSVLILFGYLLFSSGVVRLYVF